MIMHILEKILLRRKINNTEIIRIFTEDNDKNITNLRFFICLFCKIDFIFTANLNIQIKTFNV